MGKIKCNHNFLCKVKNRYKIKNIQISTAENIAWRLCSGSKECIEFFESEYQKFKGYIPGKMMFNSYNSYNSGNEKSINSLINQFIFQIENFGDDFKEFENKYSEYSYPNNLSKEEIIYLLKIWIEALSYEPEAKKCVKYYNITRTNKICLN